MCRTFTSHKSINSSQMPSISERKVLQVPKMSCGEGQEMESINTNPMEISCNFLTNCYDTMLDMQHASHCHVQASYRPKEAFSFGL